jgi:uncharacterized protein YndB with AHSA1/START domain
MSKTIRKSRSHETRVEIAASPEAVWKAITEADEIAKWFAPVVKVDPGIGGSMFVSFGPGMEGTMTIEAWEPNKHLGLAEYRDRPVTCVGPPETGDDFKRRIANDYFIEAAQGGGTILRLVHSGFDDAADWDNEYESTKGGWAVMFVLLKHGLENHLGKPARNVIVPIMTKMTAETLWAKVEKQIEVSNGNYKFLKHHGKLMSRKPRALVGVVEDLNNGLLMLMAETTGTPEESMLYCSLTVYGPTIEQADEIQKECNEQLQSLIA